jgi:hypothetical protein
MVITPCSLVRGYQRFGGIHCLHLQSRSEQVGKVAHRGIGNESWMRVAHLWTRGDLTAMVWNQRDVYILTNMQPKGEVG